MRIRLGLRSAFTWADVVLPHRLPSLSAQAACTSVGVNRWAVEAISAPLEPRPGRSTPRPSARSRLPDFRRTRQLGTRTPARLDPTCTKATWCGWLDGSSSSRPRPMTATTTSRSPRSAVADWSIMKSPANARHGRPRAPRQAAGGACALHQQLHLTGEPPPRVSVAGPSLLNRWRAVLDRK